MKVIKPVVLTEANVVSTSATETYAAYNGATTYALGDRAIVATVVYECIQAPNVGHAPATSPLWWVVYSPTNKWAMFDSEISTATTQATSLSVTIAPGICNSMALFGLVGTSLTVTVLDAPAGATVYSKTFSLDGTVIADWYQYFFEPSVQLGELVLTDLPPYSTARVTITITGAQAACAMCSLGTFYYLGSVSFGATVGLLSFSTKTTSATGVTSLKKGKNSNRISVRMVLKAGQMNNVNRVLKGLDGVACAWLGTEDTTGLYAPLVAWGFFRDFSLEVAYPTISYCNLEIEGMA